MFEVFELAEFRSTSSRNKSYCCHTDDTVLFCQRQQNCSKRLPVPRSFILAIVYLSGGSKG